MPEEHLFPILKLNWERRNIPSILSKKEIQKVFSMYFSDDVSSIELFSKGCVNFNYKVTLSNGDIFVFRVYTRDEEALAREFHLHALVQDKVPVPRFLYINNDKEHIPYPYGIMEYVEGRLFREVILEEEKKGIEDCSYEAGKTLVSICSFDFRKAGFLYPDLSVDPFGKEQTLYTVLISFLKNPRVLRHLGKNLVEDLSKRFFQHKAILEELSFQHSLVHADYDPSNMLVRYENGYWKIVAILDWEFAFSGSYYLDVGLMLRYAPQLPSVYQEAFIDGMHDADPTLLQTDWEVRAKLLDCLSLLSLCTSDGADQRPNMIQDIKRILSTTCQLLS